MSCRSYILTCVFASGEIAEIVNRERAAHGAAAGRGVERAAAHKRTRTTCRRGSKESTYKLTHSRNYHPGCFSTLLLAVTGRNGGRLPCPMAALYDSTADRANEHFLNYMTSCALGEISVESGSGAGGCESAAVHLGLARLQLDVSGDDGERCAWL